MKINTDGVLLAALAEVGGIKAVLDIGTGTGVIALMLAQRNTKASIHALEIDADAAASAQENFEKSKFHDRITAHNQSFQEYFKIFQNSFYDLIISNPPFFINALKSDKEKKNLARHTNEAFFEDLMSSAQQHLTPSGTLQIIVPTQIEKLILSLADKNHLQLQSKISISSFPNTETIRSILIFGKNGLAYTERKFDIYAEQGVHSTDYQIVLKDFFTIF